MKTQLTTIREGLELLERFSELHPLELPESTVSPMVYGPSLTINVRYAPNEHGRNKMLSVIGDTLGRDGWVKYQDRFTNEQFNFKRKIDGVLVIIEGAEMMPERIEMPVPPSAFPILIEDAPAK